MSVGPQRGYGFYTGLYVVVASMVGAGILKIDYARALLETNKPENDQEAIRNLELARQSESGSFELWRLMATAYSRQNNAGMTSLARAEMAILRGDRNEATAHAAAAPYQRKRQPLRISEMICVSNSSIAASEHCFRNDHDIPRFHGYVLFDLSAIHQVSSVVSTQPPHI